MGGGRAPCALHEPCANRQEGQRSVLARGESPIARILDAEEVEHEAARGVADRQEGDEEATRERASPRAS